MVGGWVAEHPHRKIGREHQQSSRFKVLRKPSVIGDWLTYIQTLYKGEDTWPTSSTQRIGEGSPEDKHAVTERRGRLICTGIESRWPVRTASQDSLGTCSQPMPAFSGANTRRGTS